VKRSIVILGGMGPQASLELHRLLLAKHSSRRRGAPFPSILHMSLAIDDFVEGGPAADAAVAELRETCRHLPLSRATAIGLACNGAHQLVDRIPELQPWPFVSMIDEVVGEVVRRGVDAVGLLASPYTVRGGIYSDPLQARGIRVLTPRPTDQESLASLIVRVAAGEDPALMAVELGRISDALVAEGAQCLVLGCTELPLIGSPEGIPSVSSLDTLADVLLDRHYQDQLEADRRPD
jgi:aspartate racemase